MYEIRVERTLSAPAEHVFELISDHAGYRRFSGITSAELIREGTEEKNGLGAVRRLGAGPIRFEEEITAFERPSRMDYLIRDTNLPIEHEGGSIHMTARGDVTDVLWLSRFEPTTPVAGGIIGRIGVRTLSRSFDRMLSTIERSYSP